MFYQLFAFFIFLLGLIIGSFLNCVIYRLSVNGSVARGRSYCPHCKHNLIWLDLFPVLSFVLLKGKCKYCKKSISWQYPIVEIATGLLFLLIFNYQFSSINQVSSGEIINLAFLFYITSALIIIFVYDLKHYLIPDKILFPAIGIAFFYRLIENFPSFGNYLLAALVAFGFFLSIYLISKGRWMGFGDVKLVVLLGLLLGWPNILVGLFLSFFFGATIGLLLMALQKKGLKSEVPFAPFLIGGTFVTLFWGNSLIIWYTHLLIF